MKDESFINFQDGTDNAPDSSQLKSHNPGKEIYELLDRVGFLEMRQSDEKYEEWIQKLTFPELISYLKHFNGLVRNTSTQERSVDGDNVQISSNSLDLNLTAYLPPETSDKIVLMEEFLETLKKIKDNEYRAQLTYYIIQILHPFRDGNGRLGRLMYKLLSPSSEELTKENLTEMVSHEVVDDTEKSTGRNIFAKEVMRPEEAFYYPMREMANEKFGDEFEKNYGGITLSNTIGEGSIPENIKVTPEKRALVGKIIGEHSTTPYYSFRSLTVLQLLSEKGKIKDYQYENTGKVGNGFEDTGKKILGIDYDKFRSTLDETDIDRLIEINKETKLQLVRKFFDTFSFPEEHIIHLADSEIFFYIADIYKYHKTGKSPAHIIKKAD